MVNQIPQLHIRFDFDVNKGVSTKDKTSYDVNCVTYVGTDIKGTHKLADAMYENGVGLFVFPLQDNMHKSIRSAFVKLYPARKVTEKAKWTDNGFLFKEVE